MKRISLSDIRPQLGTFTLEVTGELVHQFRKISLDDYGWVEETFGETLDKLFAEGREVKLSVVAKLFYHQLKDRSPFKAETKTEVDEEGEEREVRISGVQKFRQSIVGIEEQMAVVNAFLKTMGMSQPLTVEKVLEEGKKKKDKALAGARSLTS